MKQYTVYKHTTPSSKVYIGITSWEPSKRFANGRGYKNNQYFAMAIKKYGWHNITHKILHTNLTLEDAESIEKILIEKYQSCNKLYGYNIQSGGIAIKKHSNDTKNKISNSLKGHIITEDTKAKISNALIGNKIAENIKQKISKTLTGIKRTEESKRKMSLAKKIKLQCPFCNKIGGGSQMKRWHFNNCKIANDRLANWKEDLLRQDKWLNDRGVMDFESDIKEEVKQKSNQISLF